MEAGSARTLLLSASRVSRRFGSILALGFFSVLMTPTTRNFFVAARRKAEMDIVRICSAVDIYAVESGGRAPETLNLLVTPDENGRTYLKNRTMIPQDPWGHAYGYEPPTSERDYRVFTLGRDGKPGGTGDDADIDNVTIAAKQR